MQHNGNEAKGVNADRIYEVGKLDYEKTLDVIKLYTDIRFRLLTLLPIATGAALSVVKQDKDSTAMQGLILGLMGFFVTIGIVTYDQRNSELYESAISRAKELEKRLGMLANTPSLKGGVIASRPGRRRHLFNMLMWHDRGLAFMYSSVFAIWSYLIISSAVLALKLQINSAESLALNILLPFLVGSLFWYELHRLDGWYPRKCAKEQKDFVKNWNNLIDEVQLCRRFDFDRYSKILVTTLEISATPLPPSDERSHQPTVRALQSASDIFTNAIHDGIRGSKASINVVGPCDPPNNAEPRTLVVRGKVSRMQGGSKAKAYWWGCRARNGIVEITGDVIDAGANQVLLKFKHAKSSGMFERGDDCQKLLTHFTDGVGNDIAKMLLNFRETRH